MAVNVNHPYHIAGNRLTAVTATNAQHIYQMVEQILFTSPGERVNRPDFGCGLRSVIFAAGDTNLLVGTQATIQSALQRWLANDIKVDAVNIAMEDSTLLITVQYMILKTGERQTVRFEK